MSPDGLTYVFKLRPGVKFHNGAVMNSADVVASIARYRKLGASANLLGAIDTVSASGPLKVTMKLKEVQSTFIDNISSPRAPIAIYPAAEAAKPPAEFKFIGTGPFKFVEYVHAESKLHQAGWLCWSQGGVRWTAPFSVSCLNPEPATRRCKPEKRKSMGPPMDRR